MLWMIYGLLGLAHGGRGCGSCVWSCSLTGFNGRSIRSFSLGVLNTVACQILSSVCSVVCSVWVECSRTRGFHGTGSQAVVESLASMSFCPTSIAIPCPGALDLPLQTLQQLVRQQITTPTTASNTSRRWFYTLRIFYLDYDPLYTTAGNELPRSVADIPPQTTATMPVDYSKWVREVANRKQLKLGLMLTGPSRMPSSSATTRTSRSIPMSTSDPLSGPSRTRSTSSDSSARTRSRRSSTSASSTTR